MEGESKKSGNEQHCFGFCAYDPKSGEGYQRTGCVGKTLIVITKKGQLRRGKGDEGGLGRYILLLGSALAGKNAWGSGVGYGNIRKRAVRKLRYHRGSSQE